jgi:hypothetical protein
MKTAYRVLAMGCIVAMVTNLYKHGWSIGGFGMPLVLALLLLSLGTARVTRFWKFRFYAALSVFAGLLGFVIYSAAGR